MDRYIDLGLKWAEKYGIVEYTIKGSLMIYYRNHRYPEGDCTYKHIVNLDTNYEQVTLLNRLNKKGWTNSY